jgi:hypothetical protein
MSFCDIFELGVKVTQFDDVNRSSKGIDAQHVEMVGSRHRITSNFPNLYTLNPSIAGSIPTRCINRRELECGFSGVRCASKTLLLLEILLEPTQTFLSCGGRPVFGSNPSMVAELINQPE